MRRFTLALSLGLITTLTAPATGQDAANDVDPGALMRTAMGTSEAAQEARNALRELSPEQLMPFKEKIAENLQKVRRTCERFRMDRVKALAKANRSAREGEVKAIRARALKLISTYTKAQQQDVDELVNQIKAIVYADIDKSKVHSDKLRTAMYGWYLFRDLAIKTGSLPKSDPMPYIAITQVDEEGKLRAWMKPGWEKVYDSIDDIPEKDCSVEEKACIKAVNRYRMLMGMNPDEVDVKLVACGRAHSKEMKTLGYFAHVSPTPANSTFGKRAGNFGTSAKSENIAQGQQSGEAAFRGWYNSPGHHRNILSSHGRTGVGEHGRYWTQMFG